MVIGPRRRTGWPSYSSQRRRPSPKRLAERLVVFVGKTCLNHGVRALAAALRAFPGTERQAEAMPFPVERDAERHPGERAGRAVEIVRCG